MANELADAATEEDALPSGEPEYSQDEWVLFNEAANWIAFGDYIFPGVGRRSYLDLMVSDGMFEEESTMNKGRFDLAVDQLLAAIGSGKIRLFGRYEKTVGLEVIDGKQVQNSLKLRMHELKPEDVAKDDFYENDDSYHIADQWYDRLVVKVNELERVFAPFQRFASHEQVAQLEVCRIAQEEPLPLIGSGKKRGRPRIWNWDEIFAEVIALANTPDGLPETRAALSRFIAEYCQRTYGNEPSPSTVKEKVSSIFDRLSRKAGNSAKSQMRA